MHPELIEADANRIVTIVYTNYKGQVKRYHIIPHNIRFGRSEFYPSEQWLMDATDTTRNVTRTFAMQHIHSWALG